MLTLGWRRSEFDVYVIEAESLFVGRFKGTLDFSEATRIVEFREIKESKLRNWIQSLL
jgi:hypothetical protein